MIRNRSIFPLVCLESMKPFGGLTKFIDFVNKLYVNINNMCSKMLTLSYFHETIWPKKNYLLILQIDDKGK